MGGFVCLSTRLQPWTGGGFDSQSEGLSSLDKELPGLSRDRHANASMTHCGPNVYPALFPGGDDRLRFEGGRTEAIFICQVRVISEDEQSPQTIAMCL